LLDELGFDRFPKQRVSRVARQRSDPEEIRSDTPIKIGMSSNKPADDVTKHGLVVHRLRFYLVTDLRMR